MQKGLRVHPQESSELNLSPKHGKQCLNTLEGLTCESLLKNIQKPEALNHKRVLGLRLSMMQPLRSVRPGAVYSGVRFRVRV